MNVYNCCSGKNYGNLYDISSAHDQEKEDPRFSCENEHCRRTFGNKEEKKKGTEKTVRLKNRSVLTSLKRRGEFKKVFEQGLKFSSRHLIIYAQPNGLSHGRLGLSVSRKVGKAVIRNRVRRRIREIFRKEIAERPVRFDFVVVAKNSSPEAGFTDLRSGILRVLSGLVNEDTVHRDNQTV
jgi:ribonuclease P protein component